MKKMMTAILAAALCLFMMTGALAQTTLTPYATVEDASFISDSDLLRVPGSSGYAVAAADGTPLTEAVYGSSMSGYYGYITVNRRSETEIMTAGLLDSEGVEVMPCEYGDIDVLSAYWAVGVRLVEATKDNYDYTSWSSDDVYLIDTVDVYWLPEGKSVASIARANYSGARAYGDIINIEDRATGVVTAYDGGFAALGEVRSLYDEDYAPHYSTFSENGQQGLTDPEGNVVMAPAYRYVSDDVRDGYFTVSTGDLYGLADLTGAVVVPAEYERVNSAYYAPYTGGSAPYVVGGYVCVVKEGKLGYAAVNAGETCEPKYAKDNLDNNGVSALFTDMAGNINILAADGVETMIEGYDRVSALEHGSGLYYRVTDSDYNYGMIDWHGSVIVPCENDTVAISGSGRYVLVQKDYSSPAEIYELSHDEFDTRPAGEAAEAAGAEPAEASAGGNDAVKAIVENAASLLDSDAGTAKVLLENAQTLLAGDEQASAVLSSALTLLNLDAEGNASAVATLLETLAGMLG